MRRVAVYAGTRNLYEAMKTALTSLLANNRVDTVYLLIEDNVFPYELPENVKAINISKQNFFPEDGANYKSKWTYCAMIRVALSKMFPREKQALWLDCDTIVDDDISELFEMDMTGYYFAGCREPKKGDYINTGVLIMNLEEIRRDGIDDRLISLMNKKKLELPDQDAINIIAKDRIMFLNSAYNVCPFTEAPEYPKIYHYAARSVFDNDPLYKKYSGKETPIRTLIAIPCFDMVHTDFMACFAEMERDENTSYTLIKNTLIYNARNMIAQEAIRHGFDRVLWLDSDILFQPNIIKRLSDDMDGRDFVSGLYYSRSDPSKPVVYSDIWRRVNQDGWVDTGFKHYEDYPEGVFECAGTGFGCVMTSVELLKKLVDKYGAPFTPMMGLGEDLSFCLRVTATGSKMYCDSRIMCGHIGQKVYGVLDKMTL